MTLFKRNSSPSLKVSHARDRESSHTQAKTWPLVMSALGVVYGDIGTSPLYALKESLQPQHGIPTSPDSIFGILSLVFWSLMIVITVKYLCFILRADKQGEGGITTLLALLLPILDKKLESKRRHLVIFLALFGAGLLYGDGIITPAISVLSAVEGLEVAAPALKPFIVPITVAILILLFSFQKHGTAKVGSIFGPITLIWFFTLGLLGLPWIYDQPQILKAINPIYAYHFFTLYGWHAFFVLSSVVLCITGGEALYADMGHFGRRPIRIGWLTIVFPSLLLNYFGQGALVLSQLAHPTDTPLVTNTFYGLVSCLTLPFNNHWLMYPLVGLATAATVIASQALISGAFSLTQQAMQLGYLPRMTIRHTSRQTEGQIYVPRVNTWLMIACILLVVQFQESTHLADAYGIAVTATMMITSLLFYGVIRYVWNWNIWISVSLLIVFFSVDLAFFSANILKVFHGGWIPIGVGLLFLAIMTTWKLGRDVLGKAMAELALPLSKFFEQVEKDHPHRIPGTAVFMTLNRNIAPAVLLHHYKHNQVLHEKVILLSILTEHEPEVSTLERVRVTDLSHGFVKVVARYGYMETPNVTTILRLCESSGLHVDIDHISYYLGRESFIVTGKVKMAHWRKKLFILLSRNARPATEYFNLPPDRVMEVGSQIEL